MCIINCKSVEKTINHEAGMKENKFIKVSVGLPVFNGEKYLTKSIQSILAQTLDNFELIIVDNASSDNTEEICKRFVEKDKRIKYYRNEKNLGASANHNRTLSLASGEYFVWASYDDIRHPEYLQRCSEQLDSNSLASSCHSLTRYIDSHGNETSRQEVMLDLSSSDPAFRFKETTRIDHKVEMVLSMMRTDILKKTNGLAAYSDSDRVLMAEISLYGNTIIVPDYLFYRREHDENSSKVYKSRQSRMAWFDPKLAGKLSFPHFRQFYEYVLCIYRAPLSFKQRMRCLSTMANWLVINRKRLYRDAVNSLRATASKILLADRLKKNKGQ